MANKTGFTPSVTEKGIVKVLVRTSYFRGTEKTQSNKTSRALYRSNALIYKDGRMAGAENLEVLREARLDAMRKFPKWKGKSDEALTKLLKGMDADRRGILNGDDYTDEEGEVREHYEGTWFLKATSDRKPKYKTKSGVDIDWEDVPEKIKSGYWVILYGHFYCVANEDKGGNGVFFTLDAMQFFKKDEEFSGAGIDDDEIENLGDDDEEEDDDMEDKPKAKKPAGKRPSLDDDEEDEKPRSKAKKPADDDDEI
jgi:hypothetical protein